MSGAEYIFWLSLTLVALGPYLFVETFKKVGISVTSAGIAGLIFAAVVFSGHDPHAILAILLRPQAIGPAVAFVCGAVLFNWIARQRAFSAQAHELLGPPRREAGIGHSKIFTPDGLQRHQQRIEQTYKDFHTALADAITSWSLREHLDTRSEIGAAIERMGESLASTKPPTTEQVERAKGQLMSELRELRRVLDFDIAADELAVGPASDMRRTTIENVEVLQLRFKQTPPYVQAVHPGAVYRIGLYNPADTLIRNVQISLWKMEPTPRDLVGATDLPYPVTRPTPGQFDQPNCEPCDINPKDEGFFELAHAWTTGPPDHRLIVNHIATKGHKPMFEMHRDEMWCLCYRISCADHRPIEFLARLFPLNETIGIEIELI
jgi:hypothetical protein